MARASVEQEKTLDRVGRILTLIPMLFVILRVWCTAQSLYVYHLADYSYNHNGCISGGLRKGYITLGVLQVCNYDQQIEQYVHNDV